MTPFWINTSSGSRLAIVPRPRGSDWLEQELLAMKAAGVDVLVSLLTGDEETELGLAHEAEMCRRVGLQFKIFPVRDRSTPESINAFLAFVRELQAEVREGQSVAAHCRASIGRASVLIAALLLLEERSVPAAFHMIAAARGTTVPDTQEQVLWMERFAEYAQSRL